MNSGVSSIANSAVSSAAEKRVVAKVPIGVALAAAAFSLT
jgi:hypothetical protein